MAKIIFMGSPEFAIPSFQRLIESKHKILACFTKAEKPKNRGQKLSKTPIHLLAEQNQIPVFTPASLKDSEIENIFKNFEPDFLIVIGYGLLLPASIISTAKKAAINLHPSSLPKFRGAAPLQRTLMSGEKESEICVIKMNEKLDEGDIFLKEKIIIPEEMILQEFHDQSALIGSRLILRVIEEFDSIIPVAQSKNHVSYAPKISKIETKIDFTKSGSEILNLIRGLNPFPAAYFDHRDKRIKLFKAKFIPRNHKNKIGSFTEKMEIFCQDGIIIPEILQPEGRNKISLKEFLNGQNR